MPEPIKLKRDCEAILIPAGNLTTLPEGMEVRITQSLGGSYTVSTENGYLVRIDGVNADALGMEKTNDVGLEADAPVEKMIWDQLKTVYDPEIPVNIADLGLIYECLLSDFPDGEKRVEVKMTLTAPGCGMGDVLREEVKRKLLRVPHVKDVNVEVVWEPVWDRSKMSDAAKLQLGML